MRSPAEPGRGRAAQGLREIFDVLTRSLGSGITFAQSLIHVSPGRTSMYARSAERSSASLKTPPSPATTFALLRKKRGFFLAAAACGGGGHIPCAQGWSLHASGELMHDRYHPVHLWKLTDAPALLTQAHRPQHLQRRSVELRERNVADILKVLAANG